MPETSKARLGPQAGEHQNVARAALVIETLCRARERGLRLVDVIRESGLSRATTHRLLAGLTTHGFVDYDKETNRYFLGLKMLTWAAAATERYGLAPFLDSSLDRLCVKTQDTVYFSLISGVDSVCVDHREGSYPIKTLTLSVGDRRPLGVGAASMALLAFQKDEFIEKVLETEEAQRLKFGFTTDYVRSELAKTRKLGYALNDGHLIAGMYGVAVPVRKDNGQAIAAITVAAVSSRLSGARLETVVGWMREEAEQAEKTASEFFSTPFIKRF
jgi:DNA-binding IclR family transcriptional regulator